jgi:hypothetical protein
VWGISLPHPSRPRSRHSTAWVVKVRTDAIRVPGGPLRDRAVELMVLAHFGYRYELHEPTAVTAEEPQPASRQRRRAAAESRHIRLFPVTRSLTPSNRV